MTAVCRWREVRGEGGAPELEAEVPLDRLDRQRLLSWAELRHPRLARLAAVERSGDGIRLRIGSGNRLEPRSEGADEVLAVLSEVFGTTVRPEQTLLLEAGVHGALRAPDPNLLELGPTREEPPPGCLEAAPGHRLTGHRLAGYGPLRELAAQAVASAGAGPRLLVLTGERGSGRSSLLDRIGVDAGLSGAAVRRRLDLDADPPAATVLYLLDDIDRCGCDTIDRLAVLAERSAVPVLAIATACPAAELPAGPALPIDRIAIPPLTVPELVAGLVPAPAGAARSLALEAARRSGGHPRRFRLWLDLLAQGVEPAVLGVALRARASGLTPAARELLGLVAASAGRLPPETVERALSGPAPWQELEPWLVEPASNPSRSGVALVPELSVLARDAAPGEARERHRRLAVALEGLPGLELERGLHLATAGDARAALPTVLAGLRQERNGERALELLASVLAVCPALTAELRDVEIDLLERSGRVVEALARLAERIAATPAGPERERARLRRAGLLARAGRLGDAASELDGLAPGDAVERLRARELLGYIRYRQGALDEARQAYESCLSGAADLDELRAPALSGLGYALVRAPGGSRRGERMLAEAREIYARLGDTQGESRTLSREASARGRRGDLEGALSTHLAALERALAIPDRSGAAECHVDIASVAFDLGELGRAERHLREAARLFAELGDSRAETLAGANLAALAIELGRPEQAQPVLERALARDREAGAGWHEAHDLRFLGLAALAGGRLTEARERLEQAEARFRTLEDEEGRAEAALGLALVALDAGEPQRALAAAEGGLRALAPRSGGSLHSRLLVLAARARLAADSAAHATRSIGMAIACGEASADSSVRAEAALVDALSVVARDGAEAARGRLERALELGEAQERPDVLGRILAAYLTEGAAALDAERAQVLVERLRELHAGGGRRGRLERLGIRAALAPAPRPDALEQDALLRLEAVLEGAAESRSDDALRLLAEKVVCLRAAILVPDAGQQLRVAARRVSLASAECPGAAFRLALRLAERARLLAAPIVLDAAETLALGEPEEVAAWGLGSALAAPGERGLVLYLDRPKSMAPFAEVEARFVRAVARRLGAALEPDSPEAAARTRARRIPTPEEDLGLVGSSAVMQALRQELGDLARFEIPVFLHGESGTGKELAAHALHRLSRRSTAAFVAINCAALPEPLLESELFGTVRGAYTGAVETREGLLARAERGTIFLDEVAELSPAIQAKLLRVVELGEFRPLGASQSRRADVRFLSATNRDVHQAVRDGRFREDLYYRLLATATVELPPLRERSGDIPVLTACFAEREAARHGVAPMRLTRAALERLERHPFPGNVRELERLVAGLVARHSGRRVDLPELEAALRSGLDPGPAPVTGTLAEERLRSERRYLERLLLRHRGNRTRAARDAGVARQTLIALLKRHGLERREEDAPALVSEPRQTGLGWSRGQ